MKYHVIITDGALSDVEKFLDYLIDEQGIPQTAERWWRKAMKSIYSLSTFPHRCPKPPDDELRDYTIRAMAITRSGQ